MKFRSSHFVMRTFVTLAAALAGSQWADRAESKDILGGSVTYAKHIAAILWKNCAACHRPGEVGPFSLLTYEDASKRAEFIAEITSSRRMPPWRAEPNFGKFRDERRLSDRDIDLIAKWAEAGAPEGDAKDLPKPPSFPEGWQLGEPDMLLKMAEPFSVPAGGNDVYRCFVIPIPIENNKMVSAVEFRPGNAKVVHHAIMFLDANGAAKQLDGVDGKPGFPSFGGPGIKPTGGLGGWTPGTMPRFLPEGLVRYVKKGSDLVLQVHYHPIGKAETDQSVIGVHFSKKPVSKIITGIAVLQTGLKIPAGDAHCEITAQSQPLPVNVNVLGLSPHMHNLGREFKVTAKLPDGSGEVPLIWIKDWDFNWQGAYQFEKPVRLPKGSTINVQAIYDNSEANPKNPHSPPEPIHWGEQTTDEMCLCGVQVFADRSSDLKQIAAMPGNELGAGLDGGIPGQAEDAKQKAVAQKTADKKKAATQETAKKRVDKKEAQQELADGKGAAKEEPSTQETADAEPTAKEAAKAKPAAKAAAKSEPAFPADGIAIPESFRLLFTNFDSNRDGRLSREEFNKLPSSLKLVIRRGMVQNSGGNEVGIRLDGAHASPAEETKNQAKTKMPAAKKEAAKPAADEPVADADDAAQPDAPPKATKPAPKTVARTKAAAKTETRFPAAGLAIPEDNQAAFADFDLDGNGRLSREEFDQLPSQLKDEFPGKYSRLASRNDVDAAGGSSNQAEETTKKTTAKKRAVKKQPANPAAEEPVADANDVPQSDAASNEVKPLPKTAAPEKAAAKTPPPFPAEGITLTENAKPLLGKYDTNGDGKLSKDEFDKMPAGFQSLLRTSMKLR